MKAKILTVLFTLSLTMNALAADASPSPTPQPDKLKEALAQMLTGVTQTTSEAKEFIVSQLPDAVRQLLAWKFAESIARVVFGTILLVAWIIFTKKFLIQKLKIYDYEFGGDNEDLAKFFGCIGTAICSLVVVIVFFCCLNLTWLQIWIAPKVYLIEYAKTLVGK
jgi:hypothetical protein